MRFKTTFAQTAEGSPAANASAAVGKIKRDFVGFTPSFLVFFAAVDYDPDVLAREMQDAFPGAVTMGCTTQGEACDEKILYKSVVAMGFSDEVFEFSETALVLADADAARAANSPDTFSDTTAAMQYLGRNLDKPLLDLDYRKYVGFLMGAAANTFNEGVIERIGEMTNVFFTGGIAADNYTFDRMAVFYKGKAYRGDAVALALWKPKKEFALLKTQAVELTDKRFTITKADEDKRIIWEFDGRDAAQVYAEAIGVPVEKIGQAEFDQYLLAMVADGEPYLRVAIGVVDGKGLQIYLKIREGTRLTLTKAVGFVEVTGKAIADKIAEAGWDPEAVFHLNCCCRYTVMEKVGVTTEFGKLFARWPHISYASYGEVYANLVAITSVMVLFK
jgi:hypothetical protein